MEVVAWAGLVLSWIGLVFLVKLLFISLRVLKQIRRLAEMARDAAVGLADNLADEERLAEMERLAGELTDAVAGLPSGAAAARPYVSSISPGVGRFP